MEDISLKEFEAVGVVMGRTSVVPGYQAKRQGNSERREQWNTR